MALDLITATPEALLAEFKKRVSQSEQKGKITTWEENSQGNFTHKADQVHGQAWFCATIQKDRLRWNLRAPGGKPISRYVFAYYHGHLTEAFINHFPKLFTSASCTANKAPGDNVSGEYAEKS
ncbi:hypothetical protein I4I80_10615 [Pseudomonas syringae pv. tomato]|nr:hypothetical protein [Pseudomonas syringae pv. tomato]MBW8020059.1 hypothetical protein [Pseudomonas syringae pv. tomato]